MKKKQCEKCCKVINIIAMIFVLFGGINWGLVGVADFNIIMWVFIAMPHVQHLIYILTGLSALWVIFRHKRMCTRKSG